MKRYLWQVLSVFLMVSLMASGGHSAESDWQAKWKKIVSGARQEGKLRVYGNVDPKIRKVVGAAFREKFGVQMDWVVGRSSTVARKYFSEQGARQNLADIFHMGGGTTYLRMKPRGVLASLEPHLILPEIKDPKNYVLGKVPYLDKDKMAIALISPYLTYVAINTKMVKKGELKSYRDLVNPKWKGKIILGTPTVPGTAAAWATFMIGNAFGLEEGTRLLRDLAAMKPEIIRDGRLLVEWVARGKYAIGIGARHVQVSKFKQIGASIDVQRFIEGGDINAGSSLIELPHRSPHRNAAIAYLNWALTKEGQAVMSEATASPPIRKGVTVKGIDPIKIANPGEKTNMTNEEFYKLMRKALKLTKTIFAASR